MNIEQIQLSERGTLTALLHEKSNEMKNAAAGCDSLPGWSIFILL